MSTLTFLEADSDRIKCRDHGPRGNRQQTRLIWLVEEIGLEKFRELCGEYMGGIALNRAVKV